jgi:hypothetical protein
LLSQETDSLPYTYKYVGPHFSISVLEPSA